MRCGCIYNTENCSVFVETLPVYVDTMIQLSKVVVCIIVLLNKYCMHAGNQTRSATLTQHTSPQSSTDQQPKKDLVYDQDLLYENDFSVGPINDDPSTEYSYTVVAHSRKVESNNGLEMNPCIAYGKTTRPS